jgi:CheY-like chemotaxis protein
MVCETFPKSITVETFLPNDLWPVRGNPTQLHQVLLNLCVNARDAMSNGGRLVLQAECRDVDEIYAASAPDARPGRFVRIRVQDTGTGMPPEIVEHIFDPFFTTKSPEKGTGLGLSTVLGIVRSHDGFMRVYSQPGNGTTFDVYLPASGSVADTGDVRKPASDFRGSGEIVLVVDDEPAIRNIQRILLHRFNFTPVLAADGVEGLVEVATHRNGLHAIITDMHMPNMDGINFVRAVRRLLPEVPIVATSGRFDGAIEAELEALDVTVRLPKPYTETALGEALRSLLAEKRPA